MSCGPCTASSSEVQDMADTFSGKTSNSGDFILYSGAVRRPHVHGILCHIHIKMHGKFLHVWDKFSGKSSSSARLDFQISRSAKNQAKGDQRHPIARGRCFQTPDQLTIVYIYIHIYIQHLFIHVTSYHIVLCVQSGRHLSSTLAKPGSRVWSLDFGLPSSSGRLALL